MRFYEMILDNIISWAANEPEIRAVILEGSRALGAKTDELSDYDLNLFTAGHDKYISDNDWMKKFDAVLVYQKEKILYENFEIPTRLVIYKNSPRVDFSFWPLDILRGFADNKALPEAYKNGYSVLLDKDGVAAKLPPPGFDGFIITRPEKDELLTVIYDFWFEACIIAKYLKRDRLWFANVLANGPVKSLMLKVILWNESGRRGWNFNGANSAGKDIESHTDDKTKEAFNKCFSEYNEKGIYFSLLAMTGLFKTVSKELAVKAGVIYPEESVAGIEKYISDILTDRQFKKEQ